MSRRAKAGKEKLVHRAFLDEKQWVETFLRETIEACPRRRPTSEDERRAQERVGQVFDQLGISWELRPFRFHPHLYANLALHFGVGVLGSLVGHRRPALGMALQLASAFSYVQETTRKGFGLRRLFRWHDSQNFVATLPAEGEPRRRIVFVTHIDAAYTGLLFQPEFVERFGSADGPLSKSLRVAVGSLFGLAAVDAVALLAPSLRPQLRYARAALSIPAWLTTLLNLEVVLRDEIVPGANDNLSGVAGMALLAHRLRMRAPCDTEFVFVATGCEEASLGGADALAAEVDGVWDRSMTWIVGLDGLANGELRFFTEGEVFPVPLDPTLRATVERLAASEPGFAHVQAFEIPVGGTDAIPFALRGYRAVTLGTVAPGRLTPEHYHCVTDTAENLDAGEVVKNVAFVMALVEALEEAG
jgi:hypothetical protein